MNPLRSLPNQLFGLCMLLAASQGKAAPLPADWQSEQSFVVSSSGLIKLALPVETLNAARPALEDLRLYNDAGNEVPYVIEHPAPVTKLVLAPESFEVTLNPNSTIITIGTRPTQPLDSVFLKTPGLDFIKAVSVEASADNINWQTLVQGQPIFRQPSGASHLQVSFPAGPWKKLRLIVDDRRSQPVPFTGAVVHTATDKHALEETIPVEIVERDENPGETRLGLSLGAANLNIASLKIQATESLFMRQVRLLAPEVSENSIKEQILSQGTVFRVAVEGQTPSEKLSVPLESQVRARESFVVIKNGDSPPLAFSGVQVSRHPVYLVFLAQQPGTYHLLTGNFGCPAPHYDLAPLGISFQQVAVAYIKLPPPAANPDFRPPELLPSIGENGAALGSSAWKFRKPVNIMSPGVQLLDLDLDVLAHAARRFDDLRLLHGSNQVPFIIERTSISRAVGTSITSTNDSQKPSVSRWIIKLPQSPLPLTRLTCSARAPLFKRTLVLYEIVTDEQGDQLQRELGRATWTQTPDHPSKEFTLAMDFPPASDTLILETENGDNPPIGLVNFQPFYSVTRILFKAQPADQLYLYYGNPEASTPDYDLSLVTDQLLAARKNIASLSAEEQIKNPAWRETHLTRPGKMFFWGILAFVVVGLIAIIARLLPSPKPLQ